MPKCLRTELLLRLRCVVAMNVYQDPSFFNRDERQRGGMKLAGDWTWRWSQQNIFHPENFSPLHKHQSFLIF